MQPGFSFHCSCRLQNGYRVDVGGIIHCGAAVVSNFSAKGVKFPKRGAIFQSRDYKEIRSAFNNRKGLSVLQIATRNAANREESVQSSSYSSSSPCAVFFGSAFFAWRAVAIKKLMVSFNSSALSVEP